MTTETGKAARRSGRDATPRSRLPAKLSRPRLAGVVDRPRLFALADAQRERPLLWITGAPGAGKTTLVGTWLAPERQAALWYRVDADDADPATFFSFLAQGARARKPGRKINLAPLTPEYLLDLPGFSRRFFRTLFNVLPADATLVLDGYENARSEAMDGLLALAVGEVPPGARIVVTSRGEPPAALAPLAAKGLLAVIREEDMRLSLDEAQAIAATSPGRSPAPVDTLYARCDGWAAGFVVMLEHARRTKGVAGHVEERLHDALFNYFQGEMFDRVDEGVRQFLMRTALLPSFSQGEAQALCPGIDVGSIIRRLYQHHFFIERGAGTDPAYRYHALFREFLLLQGNSQLAAEQRKELLVRGADLLAAAGRGEDAVPLYVEAGAWNDAARLLCGIAPALLVQGRSAWLDAHIGALPGSVRDDLPWLGYWLGMARLPFAPPVARGLLEAAYRRMDATNDMAGRLLCCAGVLDTYWVEWTDVSQIDRWGAILESVIAQSEDFPDEDLRIRVLAALPGLGFRAGSQSRLIRLAIEQSFRLLERVADLSKRLVLANVIAWLLINTGEWRRAQELFDGEDARFLGAELPPLHLISWYIVRCATVWVTGGFERAERELLRARTLADESGVHVFDALIAGHGAYFAISARSTERADAAIARMGSLLNPSRRLDTAHCESLRAAAALLKDDPAQALRHAQQATELAVACGSDLAEFHCRTGIAMALAGLGRPAEADREVSRLSEIAEGASNAFFRYVVLMLQALVRHSAGDNTGSLDLAREGFGIARRQGFLSGGLLYPQILDALCPVALRAGIEVDYVREVIRKLAIPPPADDVAAWPWPVRITTLGGFAIEVDGAPLEFGRKTPRRLLQLIKWLTAQRGEGSARAAIDDLWPDEEADAAMNSLDAALHRVRKLLGSSASIEFADGTLRFDRRSVRIDALAFEEMIDAAGAKDEALGAALACYRGHFLPDDADAPWTVSMHERLRSRFTQAAVARGRALEAVGRFEAAGAHYARAIDIDDLAETLYQGLMRCQLAMMQRSEGIATYRRLQRTLHARLGITPSRASDALHQSLREA